MKFIIKNENYIITYETSYPSYGYCLRTNYEAKHAHPFKTIKCAQKTIQTITNEYEDKLNTLKLNKTQYKTEIYNALLSKYELLINEISTLKIIEIN